MKGEPVHEFQLNGTPWIARQELATKSRKLLLEVIRRLSAVGFRFHANVNINDDVDTMYFVRSIEGDLVDDDGIRKMAKPPHLRLKRQLSIC